MILCFRCKLYLVLSVVSIDTKYEKTKLHAENSKVSNGEVITTLSGRTQDFHSLKFKMCHFNIRCDVGRMLIPNTGDELYAFSTLFLDLKVY